jgi:hypothetical protein|tara:strand:- start:340 stop:498 length:159 start_codon:yes stop_codon:yes gene_type:complete
VVFSASALQSGVLIQQGSSAALTLLILKGVAVLTGEEKQHVSPLSNVTKEAV